MNAAKFPDKAAFIFYRARSQWDTVSFKDLADLTNRLVSGLQTFSPMPGMRAALMLPPSLEFFALAFALLKVGIVPVIVDPAIGLRNVTECFKESKPTIYFGSVLTHVVRQIFGWGKETIKLKTSIAQLLRATKHELELQPAVSISRESPAAIIYTSGSTGLPKGVLYTHENFSAQIEMLSQTFCIQSEEIDLPAFPLFVLIDSLLGVTSIIPDPKFPPPAKIDPEKIFNAIDKFKVSNIFASPVMLNRLANYGVTKNIKLSSLKRVITAGAPAPIDVLEEFRKMLPKEAGLFGVYGATETLPVAVIDSEQVLTETRHKSEKGAGVCIGQPVDGAEVHIIGIQDSEIPNWDSTLELPAGEIGEITVKGPAVTEKYIGPEERNLFAKINADEGVIHRMGDLGYFDEKGRLWYCGRKSHRVVTLNGIFFTESIEGVFNKHPLIYRTALVGVNSQPILWVELDKKSRDADREKIIRELSVLAKDHPQASTIKTFLFMKEFPTDVRHNSKIIREKLAVLAKKRLA